jgi:hypothetical protein
MVSESGPLQVRSLVPAVVVVTVVVLAAGGSVAVYLMIIRPRSKMSRLNRLYTEGVSFPHVLVFLGITIIIVC